MIQHYHKNYNFNLVRMLNLGKKYVSEWSFINSSKFKNSFVTQWKYILIPLLHAIGIKEIYEITS